MKKIKRQIDGEDIKSLLVNMVLEKKNFKNIQIEKTLLHASLFENGLNIFQFKIEQLQLMKPTVFLPKLDPNESLSLELFTELIVLKFLVPS